MKSRKGLNLPEWFPHELKGPAKREFNKAVSEGASAPQLHRVRAVVEHPDMQKVWAQLLGRRSRSHRGEFYYPARPLNAVDDPEKLKRDVARLRRSGRAIDLEYAQLYQNILDFAADKPPIGREALSAQSLQCVACERLLAKAMRFACSDAEVVPKARLSEVSQILRAKADQMEFEAWEALQFGLEKKCAEKLLFVSKAYRTRADTLFDPNDLLLVAKPGQDDMVRAFVLRLKRAFEQHFGGDSPDGCVAIMANAVFGSDLKASSIRDTKGRQRNRKRFPTIWGKGIN